MTMTMGDRASTPLRVALVGCGWFAREAHIPALRRLQREGRIALAGLCSRSDDSIARARHAWGDPAVATYRDLAEVLADPEVDLVDLVLPIAAMPDAVRSALGAGKHVVSEKPCAPTVADGMALLEHQAASPGSPMWAVAENWRFKPITGVLQDLIRSDAIGRIQFADFRYMTYTGPEGLGWRGSPDYPGGALLDSGVHFIALLRHLMGEVDSVSAIVSQRAPHLPPADSVTALLRLAGGAEASVRLSWGSAQTRHDPTLELTGTTGALTADFFRSRVELRQAGRRRVVRVKDDPWVAGGVYALLAQSVDVVRRGATLRSGAVEALRDVAVIQAMLDSGRTGDPVRPASLHGPMPGISQPLDTFNGGRRFRPLRVIDCYTVDDVRHAVCEATQAGAHVRPMTHGYSWAPHVAARDVCLRLRGLDHIHGVDTTRKTIRVGAGLRLGELTRALAAHGLSLPSLPFVSNASVGGAVATATHGTSSHCGTVSDSVRGMTVVLASGDVRTLDDTTPPQEMRAARVAIGMLGVIVELELQAVDMAWVRLHEHDTTLAAFLANRRSILERYTHVWAHWTLGADRVHVKSIETRREPAPGFMPYVRGDNAYWENRTWLHRGGRRLRRALGLREPDAVRSSETVGGLRPPVWMSMQYGVAASDFDHTIETIRASALPQEHAGRLVEFKFLKGSDASLLGPNAEGDAALFNLWWQLKDDVRLTAFASFEALMRGLAAKPHWGKLHTAPDAAYLRRAYAHWPAFESVRQAFDPTGTFSIL